MTNEEKIEELEQRIEALEPRIENGRVILRPKTCRKCGASLTDPHSTSFFRMDEYCSA